MPKNDLKFLGEDFQYRLVHEFMEDKDFFKDLSEIVDQNMFTDPLLRVYVGVMKDSYNKLDAVPDYITMRSLLGEKARNDIEVDQYASLIDKIKNFPTNSVDSVRESAIRFFRQQHIIKTANEILRIAANGDDDQYEKSVSLLNNALSKGIHDEMGVSVYDNMYETLSDDYRETIPTGIGKLDETLEGGLGKGELGVIIGPSSFGKSQPLDSNIITPSGYKKMGDIKIGDDVVGCDGKPHKVIGVFPQGKRPIYKVSFSNGASCECDIEHLWNVNSLYQRSGKKYVIGESKNKNDKKYRPDHSFKTLTLKEILEKGFIRRGRHNFKVPVNKPVEFNERKTTIDPYLVGYYLGDGCFSRGSIAVGERDMQNVKKNLSEILGEDLHIFYRENRKIYSFDVVGETKKILKENFSANEHAENKFIPKEYLFNSIENRIAVLQGVMDADGSANKNGSCEFCSKSKQLALDVQFLVRSLGGFATIKENSSSYFSPKKNDRVDCGKRYRVTISLCDSSIPLFRIERKQRNVKYRTLRSDSLFMTNAEYVGEKEAQCILIDSEDHLYLTEDFIVTHNTSLTTSMASHAASKGFKVLQIVFEDRIKQIQRKHFGKITGVESKDLSKNEYKEKVIQILENYENKEELINNLRIVRFPTGEKTAEFIGRFIKKLKNNGFSPDLVIIDYFECLKHIGSSSTSEWEKEGITMRKLESLAGDLNVAFWIPVQGTKDSVNQELVTMDKSGGSFKKIQIAHIVVSIARTVDDIENNKATIAILKNRAGKAGKIFQNVYFNNGTCIIDTTDAEEFNGISSYDEHKNDEKFEMQKAIYNSIKKRQEKKNEDSEF